MNFSILIKNVCARFFRPPFTANANFANQQPQWNAPNEDYDMTGAAGSQTPKMSNNQKAAERMAEDESEFILFLHKL